MEKFDQFKPDEETIESWLDGFEARLLCHGITSCEKKRNWCQALVGEAGRSIIRKLPVRATWEQVKSELCGVLGDADPKDRAIESLLQYQSKGKGQGEIAAEIITKAASATEDVDLQVKLGLKAFIKALPEPIGRELRRMHFRSVREALQEARFLQKVQEEEKPSNGTVLTMEKEARKSASKEADVDEIVEKCLKQLKLQAKQGNKNERPRSNRRRRYKCWCCGEEGHRLMQCPTIQRNRANYQSAVSDEESENE